MALPMWSAMAIIGRKSMSLGVGVTTALVTDHALLVCKAMDPFHCRENQTSNPRDENPRVLLPVCRVS